MTRIEHALLTCVMSTTFAIGGCTAEIPEQGEDEPVVENQEAVEQATDDALNRWGMDGLDERAEDEQDESRCKYDDDPECKKDDDKPDVDCKDPKHACDPRCEDKDRKVCIFKSILIEKKRDHKNRHLALGAALFKYDAKEDAVDYLLYVLNRQDVASAALYLGDKDKRNHPVVILTKSSHLDLGSFPGLLLSGSIKRDDLKGALKGEPIETLVDAMKADDISLGVTTDHDKRKPQIRGHVKLIKCKVIRKHGEDDKKDPHACKPRHCDDPKHDDCRRGRHDDKHDDCKDPKDHHCREDCKDDKHSHCFDKDCKDEPRDSAVDDTADLQPEMGSHDAG